VDGMKSSEDVVDLTARARRLTLTTEELAERWGIHPESLKRAARSGASPVRPIIPGSGRWCLNLTGFHAGWLV
jgi:hypothetical protein